MTGPVYIESPNGLKLVERKGGARLDFLYHAYVACKHSPDERVRKDAENELFQEIVLYAEKVVGKQSNRKSWTFGNNLIQKVMPDSATDIGQESAIKVWKNLHTFKGKCKFSTWVFRVCANVINDEIADRVKHRTVEYWEWKAYGDPAPAWRNGGASGTPPDGGSAPKPAHKYDDGKGSPVSNSDSYGEDSGGTGYNAGPAMSKQMMQQSENEMVARLDVFTATRVPIVGFLDTLSEKDMNFVGLWAAGHSAAVIASVYRKDVRWVRNNLRRIRRLATKWKNRGKSRRSGCLRCEEGHSTHRIHKPPIGNDGRPPFLPCRSKRHFLGGSK